MISTNIILGWRSMMIDMAAISWVIFSHDAFVSQETFANKLCRGILAAKSEMNLDMRWDYLDVTGRTTDNLERLGWGQSQNPRLAMVSSSLNWINVFDPFVLPRAVTIVPFMLWTTKIIQSLVFHASYIKNNGRPRERFKTKTSLRFYVFNKNNS